MGGCWLAGDAWVLPPPLRMALLLPSAPRSSLAWWVLPAPALHPPEPPPCFYHCRWDVNSAVEWYLESGGVGHGTGLEAAQQAVPASPPGGHVSGLAGGHLARLCMGHSPVIPGAGAAHCWRGATVAAAAAVRPASNRCGMSNGSIWRPTVWPADYIEEPDDEPIIEEPPEGPLAARGFGPQGRPASRPLPAAARPRSTPIEASHQTGCAACILQFSCPPTILTLDPG